jgi:hypothetical protein
VGLIEVKIDVKSILLLTSNFLKLSGNDKTCNKLALANEAVKRLIDAEIYIVFILVSSQYNVSSDCGNDAGKVIRGLLELFKFTNVFGKSGKKTNWFVLQSKLTN